MNDALIDLLSGKRLDGRSQAEVMRSAAEEIQSLRLRCEALAILLYGPAPERTRERVQAELEACESALTALRAELAALPGDIDG